MCDPIDIVDPVGWAIGKTGLPSYRDIPGKVVDAIKGPDAPPKPAALPALPPAPPDPTSMVIQRAMAAERLRSARAGSYAYRPIGGTAPITTPTSTGY